MSVVKLAYDVSGPEDAPAVVLCHALGTTARMFDQQEPRLRDSFRVIRVDLRGHGRSPVPAGPYSMEDLGRDVLGVLDDLGIERAHLGGISLGAMLAMWIASHEPDRLDRLVLGCTAAHLDATDWWLARASRVRAEGLADVATDTPNRWYTEGFRREHPEIVAEYADVVRGLDREGFAGCCEAIAMMDLRADLGRITHPTLVVSGEQDVATPPALGRVIADSVVDGKLLVLDPAAHLGNVERGPEFAELFYSHFSG